MLFEFHRGICDQTIETSVLLTKVEELLEYHVQPLIGQIRKWGCDTSPTFKYWDMFLVAVQIMLSNVREYRDKHSISIGILIPSTTKYINMCSIVFIVPVYLIT